MTTEGLSGGLQDLKKGSDLELYVALLLAKTRRRQGIDDKTVQVQLHRTVLQILVHLNETHIHWICTIRGFRLSN